MEGRSDRGRHPRGISIPQVLASAGITYRLPGTALYSILAFTFKLVADGNAGNRQVVAEILDATGAVLFAEAAPAVQTAGTTVVYSFAGDRQPFGTLALGLMGGGFPRGELPQNLTIRASVASAQAGDKILQGRILAHQRDRASGE